MGARYPDPKLPSKPLHLTASGRPGGLGAGPLPYLITWAMIGLACSVVAMAILNRLAPRLRARQVILAFLAILAFMQCGGCVAARAGMNQLFVVVDRIWWEPESHEFVIRARSTPVVARAHSQGDLQVLVSVHGYWIKNEKNWGEIVIGPRDLLGSPLRETRAPPA